MRYDEKSNELFISSRELVTIARRCISGSYSREENEPSYPGASIVTLNYSFTLDEHSFTLLAGVKDTVDNTISLLFPTDSSVTRPR